MANFTNYFSRRSSHRCNLSRASKLFIVSASLFFTSAAIAGDGISACTKFTPGSDEANSCLTDYFKKDRVAQKARKAKIDSRTKNSAWMKAFLKKSKAVITDGLLDPESAQFSKLVVALNNNDVNGNAEVLCGYVNAKNSYGGYTGRKMFYVHWSDDSADPKVWIQEDLMRKYDADNLGEEFKEKVRNIEARYIDSARSECEPSESTKVIVID
jgi:hypothetical protein